MPVQHYIQNQKNLMVQTGENDQKPQVCENFGEKIFSQNWPQSHSKTCNRLAC